MILFPWAALRKINHGCIWAFSLEMGAGQVLGEDWAAFTPRDDELKLYLADLDVDSLFVHITNAASC